MAPGEPQSSLWAQALARAPGLGRSATPKTELRLKPDPTRSYRFREVLRRFARFVRSLFSSAPPDPDDPRGLSGGIGVREPRRPIQPTSSGAVALEPPPTESRDVWAVGPDDDAD
jgi:hypothetical protein